jgi:mannosyltransferase
MEKWLDYAKRNAWLLSILFVGALMRFYHIDFQSIWLDEIHTINEANPEIPFGRLYESIMSGEQMPPLYFYTVYFLFKIFGYTTIVMRIYSAVIGIVSLYAMYLLGKEMMGKRVGLIASLLLSVNYFHLLYSQEARPYIFLLLFSTLAFYRLIKFLKVPSLKNAIWYGVFSALMIQSHFFALFALLAQYLILLFFFIVSEKAYRRKFFLHSLLSGIIALVLFSPSIKIFLNVMKIKEFWIPFPTWDSYTIIFREFFGNSEILLTLAGIFILFYFLRLSKEKETALKYADIVGNKTVFAFAILVPWMFVVVLIPLIRSYTALPVLISRYFILVLPAIFILLSIAIVQFRNTLIRTSVIAIFVVFSITDIAIVKHYYTSVTKSQFREVTQFVIEHNKANDPVITSLPWYLPYFLNKGEVKMTVVDNRLDNLVGQMMQDPSKIKSFWYVDGHIRPFALDEQKQAFLEQHFTMEDNIDMFDCWARHYVVGVRPVQPFDMSKFGIPKTENGDKFMSNVEKFEFSNNILKTVGWAFFENEPAAKSDYNILLVNGNNAYKVHILKIFRPDNTSYFKQKNDVSNSGFNATVDISSVPAGKYQLAIHLVNKELNKEGLLVTDKTIDKP